MHTAAPPPEYMPETLTREAVAASRGPLLLDFGTGWCGHCRAARGIVEAALRAHPGSGPTAPALPHVRIEDGSGRRLGRAFGVKLWPTLVFLHDGVERARLVRPRAVEDVAAALRSIDPLPAA